MIYLRSISLPEERPNTWPFTVPAIAGIHTLALPTAVTLLAGDNGTGKSTLLEALAVKLALPAVGRTDAARDDTLAALRPMARHMRTTFGRRPINRLFLRSEDFFNFTLALYREREEMREELARVDKEYAGRSRLTQDLARMAYSGSIAQMQGRYGGDLLEAASHGESFLRLFQERLTPGGLYLLDEPEVPLSPLRQLALYAMIKDLAQQDCQFLIATHSPILLSMEGATVYDMEQSPPAAVAWDELPGVQLMKGFLNSPRSYTSRL